MTVAAIPAYLKDKVTEAPTGQKFGLFFEYWDPAEWEGAKSSKTPSLKKVTALSREEKALIREIRARQEKIAGSVTGVVSFPAVSTSPFVTGIGIEHPLENGFAFLNPYSIPYLPGASVKGVLRKAAEDLALGVYGDTKGWSILDVWWLFGFEAGSAYLAGVEKQKVAFLVDKAEQIRTLYRSWVQRVIESEIAMLVKPLIDQACSKKEDREEYYSRIGEFLSDLADSDHKKLREAIHDRGSLIFWDVIPQVAGDRLAIDILTPHYVDYYEGNSPPADCGQPIPSPFLTIPPESQFEFHVQYSPVGVVEGFYDDRWQELLEAAFEHAFDWLGFGAKTSVGYGQMMVDKTAQLRKQKQEADNVERERLAAELARKKLEEERQKAELAAMSPGQRDIRFVKCAEAQDEAKVVEIFNRLGDFPEAEKRTLAEVLSDYWIRCGKWGGKQSDKQKKKVQRIKEILESR